ncbi:ubiquinol-cytochrome C chaperone [Ancylobacter sp. 6x-1]|uniref:Ubiquinol-cytochrome C chaperone n=1 Tax=Ancylobacter crimeensis TaxID=2579147 RepID=A0ABT0DCP1_9HYPH|nr:ubiquinol-cytochrome C chaperone family protein [Ancylobacter crimeensis]MCK0197731.1 ubiquinol-cytochrome C chaperone [Ancylobacter crimeensis]
MILRFFRRDGTGETIGRLYGAIVAQARDPQYYVAYRVPDTIEGRFEMILLHLFALFHRLKREDEARRGLGQLVFDRFCTDMDANLREMGVGDLAVPKRMKKIAESFYGRVSAYDAGLAEVEDAGLGDALLRNVYAADPSHAADARALASHLRAMIVALNTVSFERLAAGEIPYPEVPAREPAAGIEQGISS